MFWGPRAAAKVIRWRRQLLQRVADAHPGSAYAHHELGLTLAGLGESDAAIAALRRARELQKDSPGAWRSLGDQLMLAGDRDHAALAYAEQAYAGAPGQLPHAALQALRDGTLPDAIRLLHRHVTVHPADITPRVVLAQTATRLGYLDDAGDMLAACVADAPDSTDARFAYAQILHAQHRPHLALVQLEHLGAVAPDDIRVRFLTMACLILAGHTNAPTTLPKTCCGRTPRRLRFGSVTDRPYALPAGRRRPRPPSARHCGCSHSGEAWWCLTDLKTAPPDRGGAGTIVG